MSTEKEEELPTSLETAREQDFERLQRAYHLAVDNLAEINDNRNKLIETLGNALTLVEHLLAEMNIADVVPSSRCVFAKANLDAAMRKLVAR